MSSPTQSPTTSPSARPTAPTKPPTPLPSSPTVAPTFYPTVVSGSICAPYSATNTNSATQNYAVCAIGICFGETVVMTTCSSGGSYTGDTYLRLYSNAMTQVAVNDDYCDNGSEITYTSDEEGCNTFYLHEGCYGSLACTATVAGRCIHTELLYIYK